MLKLFLVAIVALPLLADISLKQIDQKPKSLAKDFMIWQFFKQDVSQSELDQAFWQIDNVNRKMFFAYANKSSRPEVKYTAKCMRLKMQDFKKSNDKSCLKIAASTGKLSALKKTQRDRILKLLDSKYYYKVSTILDEQNLSKKYQNYPPELFLRVFNASYGNFRRANYNFKPSKEYINKVAKLKGFYRALTSSMNDKKLQNFASSLIQVDSKDLDSKTEFYLGINQLKFGTKKEAVKHFKRSEKRAYYQSHKDKALFWQALVSNSHNLYKKLAKSWDINFYSLYAQELVGATDKNYYLSLKTSDKNSTIDLKDPFIFKQILDEIKTTPRDNLYDLAQKYNAPNLLPIQSFIVEKASKYKLQGFLMPYDKELGNIDNQTKALIYSLMRQESRFVPAALSRSYALGLMQIMPFLAEDISKKIKPKLSSLDDMFDPTINLTYAIYHTRWLQNRVWHPLFLAYAYNGGIGFTRRHIRSDNFKDGAYEPFMSMETMRNVESREYGKKVLSNYVIYSAELNQSVSLIKLVNDLLDPSKTDRFRDALTVK